MLVNLASQGFKGKTKAELLSYAELANKRLSANLEVVKDHTHTHTKTPKSKESTTRRRLHFDDSIHAHRLTPHIAQAGIAFPAAVV